MLLRHMPLFKFWSFCFVQWCTNLNSQIKPLYYSLSVLRWAFLLVHTDLYQYQRFKWLVNYILLVTWLGNFWCSITYRCKSRTSLIPKQDMGKCECKVCWVGVRCTWFLSIWPCNGHAVIPKCERINCINYMLLYQMH